MPTTFPTWIDDASPIPDPLGYGARNINFLRKLKHPKSDLPGRAFQLDPWMERIIMRIYGPRHLTDDPANQIRRGDRIVTNAFIMIPRGNRKTSLGAALTLLHTIGPERRPHGQVICAAADQKQARIALDEAANILRADRPLERTVKIEPHKNRITNIRRDGRGGTWIEAISADGATQHGRTPDFVLMDELHAWKGRSLWEAMVTGLAKVPASLRIIITTAGRGTDGIAAEQYEYARSVALGEKDDPACLPVLFEMEKTVDWRDEAAWRRVNPGLIYGYPALGGLRQLAREAETRPADRTSFKQLHLNIWTEGAADPFVDLEVYDEGRAPLDLEALKREPCWLAVDLSSNFDLTVIVACWRIGEGYIVHPWFFCPEENLGERQNRTGQPYVAWKDAGLITATTGNVVDFRAVEQKIRELCAEFDVQQIAFDPFLARNSLNTLGDEGLPVTEFRQIMSNMMPALHELERSITGRRFQHGAHPILRMCFEHAEVETNSHGHSVRLKKGKRKLSIDGAVAAGMAVACAQTGESGRSVYADPNFDPASFHLGIAA
ncbi:terminase large subunit [Methylorubrum sp. Q1]|uniref:terminase large subunit n=1 Tax=Methylorubrum sp. Q1 TaxID=2562453 RepID=UPI0010765CD1|nr:terminase TerL endonuclease subunit [Methylorubrum sp. Q1]TFZ55925.1 terminase large subunit [Methylorubrum sp. Q1]